MKRFLIVAAHPDDEVLGCFGTAKRLINEGYEGYTLILGEGKRARGADDELDILKKEIKRANDVIGIKEVFSFNFADNAFDSVRLLDIVKVVEKVVDEVKPEIIFTHYEKDLNIDHQITYKATITATRPMVECVVKEIYSFEVLSSTEWNYPLSFSPDTFFDVSETIEYKIRAMSKYKSELREFPHPRSLEGIELNARQWGMRVGVEAAEAFKCVRRIV
ncbi:MAG: PIG-L deacetylase family protein [Nautiliaceae bacterium]